MSLPVSACHQFSDTLYCAGQPSAAELAACRDQGVKTVINLTLSKEQPFDEAAEAKALGLGYHHLPIAGPLDMNPANCQALKALLAEAQGPVLLHCGTANRAGGMLAALAYHCDGQPLDQALALGRKGGLTQLEGAVRQCLCGGE
ncbi:beta-lactamase hydrolase domain-containing protein [Gallaecimonas xiamenensis]|uniref:Beta-lactamase hydrolase-like protein phosphatase-like domain-containing protein n=1 Tax=Gallaecimonas xiamenensis 3-C-1 TaxID=745411 RepID=K2KFL4_9GAMM|nr:sulfur transferase domain-containing protein [Gallaecimonas xiamenensis]EKE76130.1 hypothetical protein B3C1_04460 [Gallaecimonas xiamenensis 3-C-1]